MEGDSRLLVVSILEDYMGLTIRELRDNTGLSQKKFAEIILGANTTLQLITVRNVVNLDKAEMDFSINLLLFQAPVTTEHP